jgi:hypothetical protein
MILKMAVLFSVILAPASLLRAQQATKSDDQSTNIQSYIDLIKTDVKGEKAEIVATMMQFTPQEAATFWPIYQSYDAQVTKLGDQRVALIKEYSDNYDGMTDEKADAIMEKSFTLVAARNALLKNSYEQVKSKLGAATAARFLHVEHQLLMIIDLQGDAQLPVIK